MKKLLTMLSTLTITTTITPTIVACKEDKSKLDLTSLNPDSFKQLDIITGIAPATTIETKNINQINDDQTLTNAIKDHIKVMTLKKVFGLENLTIPTAEDGAKAYAAFMLFWAATTPSILNIKIKVVEANKKYEIIITKEKWEKIKIDTTVNKDASTIIKPYYDLIKGDQVQINITK